MSIVLVFLGLLHDEISIFFFHATKFEPLWFPLPLAGILEHKSSTPLFITKPITTTKPTITSANTKQYFTRLCQLIALIASCFPLTTRINLIKWKLFITKPTGKIYIAIYYIATSNEHIFLFVCCFLYNYHIG